MGRTLSWLRARSSPPQRSRRPGPAPRSPVSVVGTVRPDQDTLVAWDRLVLEAPYSDVTQLVAWARLRRAAGFTPFYVLAYRDGGELVAGAQVLERHIPLLGRIGYVSNGPVIAPDTLARGPTCHAMATALRNLGRRRLRMLFVQPPEGADDVSDELLRSGFRPSNAGIAPVGSIRVDLTRSVEELRHGLSKRLRTWTRRWSQRGVTVRLGDERDVTLLAGLVGQSARHQGYEPLPAAYLRTMYTELAAVGGVALFVAEVHDRPVATELYTICGGTVRSRLTGLDRTGDAAKLSVAGALTWTAMQWAKERGQHWFDFGGLDQDTLQGLLVDGAHDIETWPSAERFKLQFGGAAFRYPPAVELIRSPLLRHGYDLARRSTRGRRLLAVAARALRGRRPPRS